MNIDILRFDIRIISLKHRGLYIRERFRRYISHGTGSVSYSLEQPEIKPDKYESGTLNAPELLDSVKV